MPKLTINDIEIEVEKGTSILQAAEMLGIEVPRFCYHDRLSVPANCRMCLVEVEGGPPKPVASCAMACGDDMVVHTDTEMVHKARKGVMEFLLINHPLDCPICDQGGECDLQDQAVAYGYDRSRYAENKRAVPNKEFGPLINTIMTRCIQCTRCVRFGDEVAGVSEIGLLHRGEDVEIDNFIGEAVSSELSGNMIDVCPVGALTSKPYAFQARPWELTKTETIDVHDALGANIRVDSRDGTVVRVLPSLHEDINEVWIDDKTRFAYDGLGVRRLDRPWVKDKVTGKLRESSWDEALPLVAEKLTATKAEDRLALAGDLCDVESMVALKDLMEQAGGATLECRSDGENYDTSARAGYIFNSTISGIEQADAILLIGTNPRHEAAMLNARIRKAHVNNRAKIALIGAECDLTYPYEHIGTGAADLDKLTKAKTGFAKTLKDAENPMLIIGMGALRGENGPAVQMLARELADQYKMVRDDWNGFNVLHSAASRVGALDVGFFSKDAFDLTDKKFVYLLGYDKDQVADIHKDAFVVYQGHHGDIGAHHADVVLPGAAYTEKDGIYVNTEGRVQEAWRAVHPPGEAKADWKILRALSGYLNEVLPYDSLQVLRERLVKEFPHFTERDVVAPAPWNMFGTKGKAVKDVFTLTVSEFYQTNAICRSSKTMAKCSESFGTESQKQQLEAAE